MAHSSLNRRKLLEQLQFAHDNGSPPPDDAEVMRLCGFTDVEQARTLYADLADHGFIRMAFVKGERRVEILSRTPGQKRERTQLNLSPSPSLFMELKARAAAADKMPGRYALDLLEEALSKGTRAPRAAPPPEPQFVPVNGKPLVRVGVLRASERAGEDLHVFCSRLLDLGLEVFETAEARNG